MSSLVECIDKANANLEVIARDYHHPVVIRDALADWPSVQAAKSGTITEYLGSFANDTPNLAFTLDAKEAGRIFYNEDMTGFNFSKQQVTLPQLLEALATLAQQSTPHSLYMGSSSVHRYLPGFIETNQINFGIPATNSIVNFWIGNHTLVAPHQDFPNNFACNVAGKRTFTLFPPEQLDNLYIGPLDFNPAGPAISLVDTRQPDFKRYPKYQQAIAASLQVTLEPGDLLFIPSMWWHQVETHDHLNLLINYWWKPSAVYAPSPMHALNLALLSISSLPDAQKQTWQHMFNHYVFEPSNFEHIPERLQGILGELDDHTARRLRAQLLNVLNR